MSDRDGPLAGIVQQAVEHELGRRGLSPAFSILFENGSVRVYKNPTDEIFVENIESGTRMRIDSFSKGLMFTTQARVEPVGINGMIAWQLSPR